MTDCSQRTLEIETRSRKLNMARLLENISTIASVNSRQWAGHWTVSSMPVH